MNGSPSNQAHDLHQGDGLPPGHRAHDVVVDLTAARPSVHVRATTVHGDRYPWAGPVLTDLPVLVWALAQVKAAAAEANADAAVLGPAAAAAVIAAADHLAAVPDAAPAAPLLLGGGAVAVNAAITDALGGPGANRSQSTADVVHTAGRVAVLRVLPDLTHGLGELSHELRAAGARWAEQAPRSLARTCLRDALPVATDLWPIGAAAALDRARDDVRHAGAPLHDVVLGGTVVGDGSGAPAAYRRVVVEHLARRSGLPVRPHADAPSALQHGDDLLRLSAALAGTARVLARVGRDLRLLQSGPVGGLGELVPEPTGDGSSFFAGKTNPIGAETAVVLAAQVLGLHAANEAHSLQAELHLDVYDLPVAVNVLTALPHLAAAAAALTEAVAATDVDAGRCADLVAGIDGHP